MDWKKYIIAFIITATIFGTAIAASNYFNNKRVEEIKSIESKIAIDILSLETQFDLLEELSCSDVIQNPLFSNELGSLGDRLDYTERALGADNPEVLKLKRAYSLLEIKDYLLIKKVSEKCDTFSPVFIFYFYSNAGDCPDCIREGHVLTALKQTYPELRVYSFDYHLNLSALKTLIIINKITPELPALVIEDVVYQNFQSVEDIEKILPPLKTREELEEKE